MELFGNLPLNIQQILGRPFDSSEWLKIYESKELPDYWKILETNPVTETDVWAQNETLPEDDSLLSEDGPLEDDDPDLRQLLDSSGSHVLAYMKRKNMLRDDTSLDTVLSYE